MVIYQVYKRDNITATYNFENILTDYLILLEKLLDAFSVAYSPFVYNICAMKKNLFSQLVLLPK